MLFRSRTATTAVGVQVTYAHYRRYRLWSGLSGELPIPGLSQSDDVQLRGSLGASAIF